MKNPLGQRLIVLAFLLVLVVFGSLVARKYLVSTEVRRLPVPTAPQPQKLREVILYFGAADGTHLVTESREIEDCSDSRDCLKETVQALLNGPLGDLEPLFPAQTQLRDITVQAGTASVDFNHALVANFPGGSMPALLAVYGLANTLATNFPYVRQVRILVDGKPVSTLKGHVDLRRPVPADFSYDKPPLDSATGSAPEVDKAPAGSTTGAAGATGGEGQAPLPAERNP